MDKKVLLALAFAFLILGFYPVVLQKFYPEYGQEQKAAIVSKNVSENKTTVVSAKPFENISETDDVLFKNDKLRLEFNPKGGVVRKVSFIDYMDIENKGPLSLVSAKSSIGAPLSVEILSPSAIVQDQTAKISMGADSVSLVSPVLSNEVQVTKNYAFRRSGYSADLSVVFKNTSEKAIDLQYELFAGSSIPARHSIDAQYIAANFFSMVENRAKLRHVTESKLGKTVHSEGSLEWVAIKDRHFSIIVKPKQANTFSGVVTGLGDHHFSAALVSPKVSLAAGESITHEFLVYMGPNDLGELLPLGLEDIVNFGKMDLIGKIFIGALEMLHKIFRNYGLAIIALTLLINLCLFPFTRQSLLSMKRMQAVQPQIAKLREQYKDNPTRLNKETMEFYKKHKVNPFGGCLPMLLQMPVFIALYVAISKFVKLIGADFLWIHDLSSPDAVPLPFTLPFLGNEIHVLPIIMIAAMVLQQRMTTMSMEGQDPMVAQQQKMMMVMMPVIFGFIFYTMPSALVLYWLTNTIFMTSYQLYLKKSTAT